MKKYLYLLIGASLALGACDDALDTTNYTQKNTGTFPTNLTDAQQMLTGIYANLNQAISTPQTSFYYLSMLASDDNLGGGGSNDGLMQAMDLLTNYGYDMTESFWQVRYEGVGRANALSNRWITAKIFRKPTMINYWERLCFYALSFITNWHHNTVPSL